MTLDDFLAHFQAVRKVARGWTAECPAHDDRSRNTLGLALGRDGRRLVKCWAGCTTREILHAAGLHAVDLFEDDPARPIARRRRAAGEPTLGEALREVVREYRRIHTPERRLLSWAADQHRRAGRRVAQLRHDATALGDTDAAWARLEAAAGLERRALALAAALDEVRGA